MGGGHFVSRTKKKHQASIADDNCCAYLELKCTTICQCGVCVNVSPLTDHYAEYDAEQDEDYDTVKG